MIDAHLQDPFTPQVVSEIGVDHHAASSFLQVPHWSTTISCSATGVELSWKDNMAKVVCPPHCEKSDSIAYGNLAHPMKSAVCKAAIVDGVLPSAGGRMLVTRTHGLASYKGRQAGGVASLSATDDQARRDVRIIDEAGSIADKGLLQVLTNRGFGSVCGVNKEGADTACRQMGYANGAAKVQKCGTKGSFACGVVATPVAMKNLKCVGGEHSLTDTSCGWEPVTESDERCMSHQGDVIVTCEANKADLPASTQKPRVRLVNLMGVPTSQGLGRPEIFQEGKWHPICGEHFSGGTALVTCRSMGYYSAKTRASKKGCTNALLCSNKESVLGGIKCTGSESNISECKGYDATGEKAKCMHGKDKGKNAVVHCVGGGNPSGILPHKSPAVKTEASVFAPKRDLTCSTDLRGIGLDQAKPGTTLVVQCPAGCGKSGSLPGDLAVAGTAAYRVNSSICGAARHAGLVDGDGGKNGMVVVTVGASQDMYLGSLNNGVQSVDAPTSKRSFSVSLPTPEVLQRLSRPDTLYPPGRYAGASTLGYSLHLAKFL